MLLGPSGCGKSTALRMIAGLERPTEGTITIGDRVVNDVEAKDRDIAMVFQSYALYPHMTVRRNIEFPLRSRHVAADEREQARGRRGREPRSRRSARPQARPALRRAAAARRPRACDRAAAAGVPHGRTALEPRRQAAGPDARRAGRAATAARGDHPVRHPRPGRGDDDGTSHRGARRGRAATGRAATGGLREAREPVRRAVHRQSADEHGGRTCRQRRRHHVDRHPRRAGAAHARARARRRGCRSRRGRARRTPGGRPARQRGRRERDCRSGRSRSGTSVTWRAGSTTDSS